MPHTRGWNIHTGRLRDTARNVLICMFIESMGCFRDEGEGGCDITNGRGKKKLASSGEDSR